MLEISVSVRAFRRCARRATAALAGLAVLVASPAQAQAPVQPWPQRNVRLILPFGAGSATDAAARLLGERLRCAGVSRSWSRTVQAATD